MKKKFLPAIGLACGLIATSAHAEGMMHQQNNRNQQQMQREITPSAAPIVTGGADLFITADFIYWTAAQSGMAYATDGLNLGITDGSSVSKGKVYDVEDDWGPGFKVGLGLTTAHDGWDIYSQYTWVNNTSKNSVSRDTSEQTNPLRATYFVNNNGPFDGNLAKASDTWKLRFNAIDFEIGRNFCLSKYLKMRPHFGVKGSWQDQRNAVDYLGFPEGDPTPTTTTTHIQSDVDYWGVGIRGGLNTAWHFNREWSVYGNFALSALGSKFTPSRVDTRTAQGETTSVTIPQNRSFPKYQVIPVFELGFGFRWEMWFSDDEYHLGFDAGWEQQVWVNMNRHMTILDEQHRHGNLSLQGFTLKARFDF